MSDSASEPIPSSATPITIDPFAVSRKRSRNEISPEDEIILPPSRTPGISPTAMYVEGMTRINPLTGTAATAETQTGTWFEDQLERKLLSDAEAIEVESTDSNDELPKRKVQRRDTSSNAEVPMSAYPTEAPKITTADPNIDQYTYLLGIGWTHLGEDSGSIAMARGFNRYIDNHYPLTDSEVLLKSKSLDSYLVKTHQGYYLFPEALTEARLVARTWEETLKNLQSSPIRFSWAQSLCAARTPDKDRHGDNDSDISSMSMGAGDMEVD